MTTPFQICIPHLYRLPQSILTNVYDFDDTYRKIFSNHVIQELHTVFQKHRNLRVIRALESWRHEYRYPLVIPHKEKMSFPQWCDSLWMKSVKATKYVDHIQKSIVCRAVSILDDENERVVPYDTSCMYHYDMVDIIDGEEETDSGTLSYSSSSQSSMNPF